LQGTRSITFAFLQTSMTNQNERFFVTIEKFLTHYSNEILSLIKNFTSYASQFPPTGFNIGAVVSALIIS